MEKLSESIDFENIVRLIEEARNRAFAKVNAELVKLYFDVGEIVSAKVEAGNWGEKTVDELAGFIRENLPEMKGFTRRGLYRMKQFYETYNEHQKFLPFLNKIAWSSHLHILSKTKSIEEKEFYIKLAIKENFTVRELERQLNSAVYERILLADKIVSTPLTQLPKGIFKDPYIFEFLNLPEDHSEKDLQTALTENFRKFILEIGKGFTYLGKEYRLQIGNHDYYLDLLFYQRDLQCLVLFELKIKEFKPEYVGKLNFYLEALDQDVKRPFENPSIGVLLCKGKDSEVVKYSLARNVSPAVIADYETKLIDKDLLARKLNEFTEILGISGDESEDE